MTSEVPNLTSVIMVSYHTGPTLLAAIGSVLAQSAPVELILIDNGNPPEVLKKLQAMQTADARMKLVTGYGNVGFSKGCNMGAQLAKGSALLFLNPDSLTSPDVIARLQAYGAGLTHPYMIGPRVLGPNGRDQRGCRRAMLTPMAAAVEVLHLGSLFPHMRLNHHKDPLPSTISKIPAISGACMYIPRDDFWAVGGFDEGYFIHVDDLDLCLRFRRRGGEIYFAPDVTVTHYGSTSTTSRAFVEKHKARGFRRYFHKNFGDQYPKPFLWLLDAFIWLRMSTRLAFSK